jgi:hypothetical protein
MAEALFCPTVPVNITSLSVIWKIYTRLPTSLKDSEEYAAECYMYWEIAPTGQP